MKPVKSSLRKKMLLLWPSPRQPPPTQLTERCTLNVVDVSHMQTCPWNEKGLNGEWEWEPASTGSTSAFL